MGRELPAVSLPPPPSKRRQIPERNVIKPTEAMPDSSSDYSLLLHLQQGGAVAVFVDGLPALHARNKEQHVQMLAKPLTLNSLSAAELLIRVPLMPPVLMV